MTNVKSLLEMYVKMGGSLTDTYSDIAGGVPVGQYSTISDAVLACSKKYSAGGGGGAEKFIVTLTEDDSGAETVWTADKTVAEIVAADAAGKIVECGFPYTADTPVSIPCFLAYGDGESIYFAGFSGVIPSAEVRNALEACLVSAMSQNGSTQWQVLKQPIPTSSNAPLIVTLTAGATEGQLVGDKTYKEVYDAFNDNTVVTVKGDLGEGLIAGSVLFVGLTDSDYTVVFCGGDSNVSAIGTANDYITVTVGG